MDIFAQDYLTDAFKARLQEVGGTQFLNNFQTVGEAVNPDGHAKRLAIRRQLQREADRAATERAMEEARQQQMRDTHAPGLSGADHAHAQCLRLMRAASLQARVRP